MDQCILHRCRGLEQGLVQLDHVQRRAIAAPCLLPAGCCGTVGMDLDQRRLIYRDPVLGQGLDGLLN